MACPVEIPCDLSEANMQFATDLFTHLGKQAGDNIFFSPISISIAFALVHLGAKGETASELERVLHYGDVKEVDSGFKKLDDSINGAVHKSALHLANRLFGKKGFDFLQTYIDQSLKFYNAELQSLDFAGDSEGSRKVINDWVESKTANKIKDIIPSGAINSMTALVLVNAIYFKGEWKDKFQNSSTRKDDFHVSETQVISTDFMKKKHKYPFSQDKDLDATVIELPYTDDNLSMFVLLPNEKHALTRLESKLTRQSLMKVLNDKRYPQEIVLSMPKFKFEKQIELHDVLPGMGLVKVFDMNQADLSGVDGGASGLYLSKAIHKAFVEVNEEGTEAAAATAGIMMMRAMPMPPREVKVDHPFLFAIVEKKTKSVLFFGRVANPTSA